MKLYSLLLAGLPLIAAIPHGPASSEPAAASKEDGPAAAAAPESAPAAPADGDSPSAPSTLNSPLPPGTFLQTHLVMGKPSEPAAKMARIRYGPFTVQPMTMVENLPHFAQKLPCDECFVTAMEADLEDED
ncbi:hypothetical protein LTS18_011124, partial [Coniosporium uncinatum]